MRLLDEVSHMIDACMHANLVAMLNEEARDMIVRAQDNWVLWLRLDDRLLESSHCHLGKVQAEGVCPCDQGVFLLLMLRAAR